MRKVLLISSAAMALGACHRPAAAPVGAANDQPHRRPGLWQESIIRDGRTPPMGAVRICVDAASDAKASVFGEKLGRGLCKEHSMHRDPDGSWRFASVCEAPATGTVTTEGTAVGDFATGYRVRSESDVDGSALPSLNGHHVMEMEVKYLGPCPADMAPGQVMLGNGMKINAGKITGAAVALSGVQ